VTHAVHVPYTVEQDEDGIWCAHAQLRPGVGANGEGDTADAAVGDMREALEALIAEFGAPDELTVMARYEHTCGGRPGITSFNQEPCQGVAVHSGIHPGMLDGSICSACRTQSRAESASPDQRARRPSTLSARVCRVILS
jgi:predicted RNase H-like HicB family nuclease